MGVDLGCYVFGFWVVVLCGFRVGFFVVWWVYFVFLLLALRLWALG